MRKQLWLLNLVAVVVVAGVASLAAAVAAVVVAVGLETVVNVVVQLGSAGHTAAAACAAPSIPLLLRAPRRPSILLQPQCRIQEDSCHSTAAARLLRHRHRRPAIAAACKLATRPTVEKNMPSYHLPICLRAACGAAVGIEFLDRFLQGALVFSPTSLLFGLMLLLSWCLGDA